MFHYGKHGKRAVKMVRIREASPADLGKIREIYNYYIRNSTATFRENEYSQKEILEKFEAVRRIYPFLVAVDETEGIAGFAYISRFRDPSAYRLAETTIYLSPHCLHRGLGKMLYEELIRMAREKRPDLTGLVACITLDNKASIGFHEKMGFLPSGTLPKAGFKFQRFCDAGFWHYLYPDLQ